MKCSSQFIEDVSARSAQSTHGVTGLHELTGHFMKSTTLHELTSHFTEYTAVLSNMTKGRSN